MPKRKWTRYKRRLPKKWKQILLKLKEKQSRVKGLIVHSLKPDNFIAGADVRMLDACKTVDEAHKSLARQGQRDVQALSDLPYPVVAAIHGPCLGGGRFWHYRVITAYVQTQTKLALACQKSNLVCYLVLVVRNVFLVLSVYRLLDLYLRVRNQKALKAKR